MNKNLYVLLCAVLGLLFSTGSYAQPVFTAGHHQTLIVCENSGSLVIDGMLTVNDTHSGTTDTWSVVAAPTHGALSVAYFTTSSGGSLTPTGSAYGPAVGYSGADSFKVMVTDGTTSDTTTVYVTVKPLPSAGTISGPSSVCVGSNATFLFGVPGGTWSTTNASASASGPTITGVSAGLDTVVFSVTNSCGTATSTATINVNTSPAPIIGSTSLCSGVSSAFSDTVSGGTWASAPTTVAAIGSSSGIATGGTAGTATISYTLTGGCTATVAVTVHTLPPAITGSSYVCKGGQIVLLSGSGGTWSSSNTAAATVRSTVGLVTGIDTGSATITYTASGCTAIKTITVNPTSPIVGPKTVCTGIGTAFSDTLTGGTWTSASTTTVIVGSGTGLVTGLSAGTATITYTLSTGCAVLKTETVNPSPIAITGSKDVCLGLTDALSDTSSGGVWSSDNTTVATVGSSSGIVSGLAYGTADIFYTRPATGCYAVKTVTVDPLPIVFTVYGGGAYCEGSGGTDVFLSGSEPGVNYLLYRGTGVAGTKPGTGSPLDYSALTLAGSYTVKAINTVTGCISYMSSGATISITPTVVPTVKITASTGDTVCAGGITRFSATPTYGGFTPVYKWMVDDTAVGIGTSSYSYGPSNGDVVTVMMVTTVSCTIPDTVYDSVKMTVAIPQTPMVSAPHADTVCQTTTVILNPVPVFGGSAPSYIYYDKGVAVGTGSSYKYHPVTGDSVYIMMISNYFCLTTDTAIVGIGIVVDTPVVPNLVITNSPKVLTGPGVSDTVFATVTNTTQPLIYQWIIDTSIVHGSTSDTLISTLFKYTSVDSVTCYVTTGGACRLTTYSWIFIENNIGVKPLTVGTAYLSVMPNPNKGEFILKGSLGTGMDEDVNIGLTDMMGNLVYKNRIAALRGDIDERITPGTLANGTYLLSIRSASVNKAFHLVVEQ